MKVAVLQSNYVPWKGYFDIVHDVDLFVFYDDVQFTKNDWRNRNRIKTPKGLEWLSIPVGSKISRLICDVELKDDSWQAAHFSKLKMHYGDCSYFSKYEPLLVDVYLEKKWENLSELNQYLIKIISKECLGLGAEFVDSRSYRAEGKGLERLLTLLKNVGASSYVSGPSGRNYIDAARFMDAHIELIYKDYSGYPEYPQKHPPFEHFVSILDLLFNCGPDSGAQIWGEPVRQAHSREAVNGLRAPEQDYQ